MRKWILLTCDFAVFCFVFCFVFFEELVGNILLSKGQAVFFVVSIGGIETQVMRVCHYLNNLIFFGHDPPQLALSPS